MRRAVVAMLAAAAAGALGQAVATPVQPPAPPAIPAGAASAASGAAPAGADCPAAQDVEPHHLLGLWHAEFGGLQRGATLLLEPHPEYAGSLAGALDRDSERSRVAADLDEDGFTLEESADGVHIAATWLGDVVEGSCGREIRGSWQPAGPAPARDFVLRRVDG